MKHKSSHRYDKEYLEMTLAVLKDNLADLSAWSVYNNDKGLGMIDELKTHFETVKELL